MKTSRLTAVHAAIACALIAGAGVAVAQATNPAAPANVLSISDIESRMVAQGITIKEIELKDLVAEVEGRDASGKKVELLIDRRSGDILSRKIDR